MKTTTTSSVVRPTNSEKQKSPLNEPVDRLSDLPNSVLVHILSFLPIDDAVKTVLLRRFGNLWTSMHKLYFDRCLYHECSDRIGTVGQGPVHERRLINLICHVLILHDRSDIDRFSLNFECFSSDDSSQDNPATQRGLQCKRSLANEVDTWIRFALKKNVKVLELDFAACCYFDPESYHTLPNFVVTGDSLTKLDLACCCIESKRQQIHMKALTVLILKGVLLSNDTMLKILSGCPLLEKLTLIRWVLWTVYTDHNFSNLKNLTIDLGNDSGLKLEMFIPYVASLSISGSIERAELKDASSVGDGTLDLDHNFCCTGVQHASVKKLIEKLQQTKVFSLENDYIMTLTVWVLKNFPCPSSDWKSLCLRMKLTKWHLPGIASLLRNSPNLEMLDIHIYYSDPAEEGYDDSLMLSFGFDEENFWNMQRKPFRCLKRHLKTIRLNGSLIERRVIKLAKFLLMRAAVLEKLVISTELYLLGSRDDRLLSARVQEFFQQFSSFPRASKKAEILFV